MGHSGTLRFSLMATLTAGTVMLAAAAPVRSGPSPMPTQSRAYGRTAADWSVAFCQWVMGLHNAQNPLTEGDGPSLYALNGQDGHVLFLVPQGTTFPTVRSVTIPSGHPLFFPIWWWTWDNYAVAPENWATLDQLVGLTAWCADHVVTADTFVVVDGVRAPGSAVSRAAATGTYYLPADCWWINFGPSDSAGIYEFAADGFYAMLPPLPVGRHTVRFGGTLDYRAEFGDPNAIYYHDITYLLDVVPAGRLE